MVPHGEQQCRECKSHGAVWCLRMIRTPVRQLSHRVTRDDSARTGSPLRESHGSLGKHSPATLHSYDGNAKFKHGREHFPFPKLLQSCFAKTGKHAPLTAGEGSGARRRAEHGRIVPFPREYPDAFKATSTSSPHLQPRLGVSRRPRRCEGGPGRAAAPARAPAPRTFRVAAGGAERAVRPEQVREVPRQAFHLPRRAELRPRRYRRESGAPARREGRSRCCRSGAERPGPAPPHRVRHGRQR